MANRSRGVFGGARKFGRAVAILAVVLGTASVLGSTRAAAHTTCSGSGPVNHFTITLPSSPFAATAGTPFTATVTAKDHCNNTVTTYNGSGTLSSNLTSSPNGSQPSGPSTINFTSGISSPSVTAVAAVSNQTATLTFSATGFTPVTTLGFSVNPGPPDHLAFTQQPNVGGSSRWLLKTNGSLTKFAATVTIYDAFGNVATNAPNNKVTLALNQAAGLTGQLGGGSLAPTNGVATFTGLTVDQTDIGYAVTPSYTTLTGPKSAPFSVYLTKADCAGQCTINQLNVDNNTTAQALGNGSFAFLGVATVDFTANGMPAGCQTYAKDIANSPPAPVVVEDTRSALGGALDVTYGISKALLQKLFGSTSGSQFVPICVGARRIALNAATNTTYAVPCDQPYNGQDQTGTGWWGKKLDANGKFDQTQLSQALCDSNPNDPGYGYFWGIIGSFQDRTNSNSSLQIDPTVNPTVTGWSSGSNYRFFTIEFPGSSGAGIFAGVPWDGWMG